MKTIVIYITRMTDSIGLHEPYSRILHHAVLIFAALFLAWISYFLGRKIIIPLTTKLTRSTDFKWDDVLFNAKVMTAACRIIPAIVIWQLLPMTFYDFPMVRETLSRLTAIYITIMSVRLIFAFLDAFHVYEGDRRSSSQQYFKSFCGVFKIISIFIAVIISISILSNKNPLTLLAGLGATSAILMLVFKETIEGLVAGIRLTSNEMLHKGDWITVPSTEVDGIVQDVTLTTVKVKNFDHTIMTISPVTLVNGVFQNWKGMQAAGGRRVNRIIYLEFKSIRRVDEALKNSLIQKGICTENEIKQHPFNLGLYRRYLEKYLHSHEKVNHKMDLMVRHKQPTQFGMPLEIYFFYKEKAWKQYEHGLADIMEFVFASASDFGLNIYEMEHTAIRKA